MAKNFKNSSTSTRKSTRSKTKPSSQPPKPVNLGSNHSEEFASSQEELSDDARSLNDKALDKRPMEENHESLTLKKPEEDLSSSMDSNINFWDTPNRDAFILFKGNPIDDGRVIDLSGMESLNCKVKELFDF